MDFSDVTVVIPAKDENAIFDVTKGVLESLEGCRVIVLYHGYGDRTLRFKNSRVKAYLAPKGMGRAIIMMQKKGLVKTPMLCFIDGDATYEPKNLRKMIRMVRGGYDMVLGNRLDWITPESMPRWIQLGNRTITLVANLLYDLKLQDSQSGLRAIRTSAFQSLDLKEAEFGIATEMNIKMKLGGFRLGESRADYYPRVGETKQMKMTGGIKHIFIELRFLFYRPRS